MKKEMKTSEVAESKQDSSSGLSEATEPAPAKVKEEFVPLKWALEDPSVLVSRRLAGTELYDRVLALRGAVKELNAEEAEAEAEAPTEPAELAGASESECKEESAGPTLDEMLASITQQNEEEGNVDQRTAVNVDDFFGAFQGSRCRTS